ncbi:MAG: hypothetical protein U5N58_06745 [Actinomycetota bacterium]|nr:hypothetical protein [Actinomycetota bacterium]
MIPRGKFVKDSDCICKDEKGNMQYLLTDESCQDAVSINQKDIVGVQLARGGHEDRY